MTLIRLLERSPSVIAYSRGNLALRGMPRWEAGLGREPHLVVLTVTGSILLIDLFASARRTRVVSAWCAAASEGSEWRFHHRPLTLGLLLALLRGAIA